MVGANSNRGRTEVIRVTDEETLERVVDSPGTVLVEFSADWSKQCEAVTKPIRERARAANCTVAVVDVERRPDIACRFDIDALPTVIRVDNGRVVDRSTGTPDIEVE